MICASCVRGDHCGSPGTANAKCPCQHRPRRDNGCPYCSGSQNPDMRDHVRNVHPDRFADWADGPSAPVSGPAGDPVDAGHPDRGQTAAHGRTDPLGADPRPLVVVLTEWMRLRRAGRYTDASKLLKVMMKRMENGS